MSSKIRKGDNVIIISGKDKGKSGVVYKVLKKNKIIIKNLNLVKKCKKPIPSKNEEGGIFLIESAIHISNVALFNKDTKKADRVGFILKDGKKFRYFKSNKKMVGD
ncbi:MAG: 50S ribosomal protein L24 [Enterobacteriaceae bacterium]